MQLAPLLVVPLVQAGAHVPGGVQCTCLAAICCFAGQWRVRDPRALRAPICCPSLRYCSHGTWPSARRAARR